MIDKPGIYQIPLHDYINDPCQEPSLSAGIAHALVSQSPLHAWFKHPRLNPHYEHEDTTATDIGTIAHALLLEQDSSRVVIVEANDWRTKDAKEARDEARAAGKLPVLRHKMGQIEAMVARAREAIAASEIATAFEEGKKEQTLIWLNPSRENVWYRSRPDVLCNDGLMLDYKTTQGSAEPSSWMRNAMLTCGYDLQAALGIRGMMNLNHDARVIKFVFIVQETEPPYALSFASMTPQFSEIAIEKLNKAEQLWGQCLRDNRWPSYPLRICYLEPPAWMQMERASVLVQEEI